MAFYIPIALIQDTIDSATYEYSQPVFAPDPDNPRRQKQVGRLVGRLNLDKSTGAVEQISGNDWDQTGNIFKRAAVQVIRNHLKGIYPQSTAYEA